MKKQIANIISSIRIVAALALFFFSGFTPVYLGIYIFCAVTDLIDGPIARKTGTTSTLGALLDAVGDTLVATSILKILFFQKIIKPWFVLCVVGISFIYFITALYSKKKFNRFYFPHTYLDKLLGVLTYTVPFTMRAIDYDVLMVIYVAVYALTAVETLLIQIKIKEVKSFVPSFFMCDKF